MKAQEAIERTQHQFEEAKRWQHLLQEKQTDEEYSQAITGIHAMGIVLDLAKKAVEEEEE